MVLYSSIEIIFLTSNVQYIPVATGVIVYSRGPPEKLVKNYCDQELNEGNFYWVILYIDRRENLTIFLTTF